MDPELVAPDAPPTADRLAALEAQLRSLKLLGGAAFLLLLAALAVLKVQALTRTAIDAQRLVLRDADGRGRAVLAVGQDGPELLLYDAEERPQLSLAAARGGAALALRDGAGREVARLDTTPGEPVLALDDDAGRPRLTLGVEGGSPSVRLCDDKGRQRAALAVAESGAALAFQNEQGKRRAWLGELLGRSRLELYDEHGTRRTLLDVPPGGPAPPPAEQVVRAERFELVDPAGRVRAQMAVDAEGDAGLTLFYGGDMDARQAARLVVRRDNSVLLTCLGQGLGEKEARRAHLGLSTQGLPFLMLNDARSQPRAWLEVDAGGEPHLNLFDRDGNRVWKAP